ncbi:MAG: hypothetical protein AABN34_21270 [Acidobacteriota bacterium]
MIHRVKRTRACCFSGWLAVLALAAARVVSGDAVARDVPVFQVSAAGAGDTVTIRVQEKAAVFDIHSRSGIGSATVELVSGPPPERIVLRLHLKGLEEFRLSYGSTVVTARVSSHDNRVVDQSVDWSVGDERPITEDSPFWMDIKIASGQSKSSRTTAQRHFEIMLPKDVLGKERRAFSIRWIDFYR